MGSCGVVGVPRAATASPAADESCPSPSLASPLLEQVAGTRGDVQPFMAIALRLAQQHGHRVRLATHAVYRSFVEGAGLEFYPLG